MNIPVYRTSDLVKRGYDISGSKSDLVISMCKAVNAKTFIFGAQGREYMNKEKFHEIEYRFQNFEHPEYTQMHGNFVSHMSFIDLLFNHGDAAINILNKSECNEQ